MKFNALIPELSVFNIEVSKNFYIDILGFHLEYERTEDKFAFLSFNKAQIMLEEVNGCWNTAELKYPLGRGINFQINVDDVDAIYKKLKEKEIKLFRDIMINRYKCDEVTYTEKELLVQDPDGYLLSFSEVVGKVE